MAETCPTCGGVGKVYRTTGAGTSIVTCPECGKRGNDWEARCRELEQENTALKAAVERLRGIDDTGDDSLCNVRRLRSTINDLKAQLAADRGIIQGSQDRAADLQRQLDEARKDVERLDWLEANKAHALRDFAPGPHADWPLKLTRAAIDAARKEES